MAEEDTQAGAETAEVTAAEAPSQPPAAGEDISQASEAPVSEAASTQPAAQSSPAPQASSGQPADQAAAERRHVHRYIAHWRAALVSVNDGGARYLGTTDNICASGVAIICEDHVPPQMDYHVYLEIPQSAGKTAIVLQLDGRVVHTTLSRKVFKVGVVFKKFHGDSDKILQAILSSGKLKTILSSER